MFQGGTRATHRYTWESLSHISVRRWIEAPGPYPSLFLLALPRTIVDRSSLRGGGNRQGYGVTGTVMICYAFSSWS